MMLSDADQPDHLEEFGKEKRPPCQLYLISPPAFEIAAHAAALEEALGTGDVAAYQLRLKDLGDEAILAAAAVLLPICQQADVAFIMNDRVDLAKASGADGVHLGQGDGSAEEARRILGPDAQIGVTCHASRHLAMEAGEAGANYVAFGAFFPTTTKDAPTRADPEILTIWQETMEVPCVAIGGITADNAEGLAKAGADFLAVSAGVWAHPQGPAAAVAALNAAIARGVAARQT